MLICDKDIRSPVYVKYSRKCYSYLTPRKGIIGTHTCEHLLFPLSCFHYGFVSALFMCSYMNLIYRKYAIYLTKFLFYLHVILQKWSVINATRSQKLTIEQFWNEAYYKSGVKPIIVACVSVAFWDQPMYIHVINQSGKDLKPTEQ